MQAEFYSYGKLLFTGEYLILRGARGLALPTSRGQRMAVTRLDEEKLKWKVDVLGNPWLDLEVELPLEHLRDRQGIESKLIKLIRAAASMNPSFLANRGGFQVQCELEFPRDWGLGSSSTLVSNVAQWAQVDPFELSERSFGGSGYDVLVAAQTTPIIFSRASRGFNVKQLEFQPEFSSMLWFIHLGRKQDSAQEVLRFRDIKVAERDIDQVSRITDDIACCRDLVSFNRLLREHDFLLSRILSLPNAKERFPDFKGHVKYLGAWGGDFMLATGVETDMDYFRDKGLKTVISYADMIAK